MPVRRIGDNRVVRLVDSHCHLNADRFAGDVGRVVAAAQAAGVERILVPGWNERSSRRALELAAEFELLDAAVGVHPHDAAKVDDGGWASITALADDARVVAIGETGLDFDRVFSPVDAQLVNLRRNLALALDTGRSAILHCRSAAGRSDAQETLIAELRAAGVGGASFAATFADRPAGVLHSYSGPVSFVRAALDLGLAVSFSGLVFRAGEEASAEAARLVPSDRLLVESDAPFLAPPGAPRNRNAPEWVRITAAWLAERRAVGPDRLGTDLIGAYDAVFGAAQGAGSERTSPGA